MVGRTQRAIIDGFNRLITRLDFNKISVDMIMKEADISRATFYRYFKDKYEVMNANYKNLLDRCLFSGESNNYRDLMHTLFQFAQENWKIFRHAFDSTGFNSFSNYIYEYSYEMALAITRSNRDGAGFTPREKLQVDVFCNGIAGIYKDIVCQRYEISAAMAADALYEMMPESLKHYWWKEIPAELLKSK